MRSSTASIANNNLIMARPSSLKPCAEEFLPPDGCCCWGPSISRARKPPFHDKAAFDFEAFAPWWRCRCAARQRPRRDRPALKQQDDESKAKRRWAGLHRAGRCARQLVCARHPRGAWHGGEDHDHAPCYRLDRARSRARAFPMFNKDLYLSGATSPRACRRDQGPHPRTRDPQFAPAGIAPTGPSASPSPTTPPTARAPFSWRTRARSAWPTAPTRVPRRGPRLAALPSPARRAGKLPVFVTALESAPMPPPCRRGGAVHRHQHLEDVNVPEGYPYADFEGLYMAAWNSA